MRRPSRLSIALVLSLCAGAVFGAVGDGRPNAADGVIEARDAGNQDVRDAGEQACREAVDTAAKLTEALRDIGVEMSRLAVRTGEEVAREIAPTMRSLADRFSEIARQLERSRSNDSI
jgi:hypothetical protein